MLRLVGKFLVLLWRWIVGVLDFLSFLEDEKPGQPRRISQTKTMTWGAMIVGALLLLTVNLDGDKLSLTETGLISVLTVAAGLMKVVRDQRRHREEPVDGYDRGGPDGE